MSTHSRRALRFATALFLASAAGRTVAAEQWSVFCDPSTLACFALDGEDLWAGGLGGLYRLDTASGELTAITTAEGLAGIVVTDLLALDGELWVATASEGLQRYRPGDAQPWFRFQTFPQGLAADALHCLVADPTDGLWYGSTAGYGLVRGGEHQRLWNELNGLANSETHSLAFTGDTLLVGTAVGLYRMDPGENPVLVAGLPATPITTVAVAADSVWVLSEGRIYGNALGSSEVWPPLPLPAGALTATAMDAAAGALITVLTVAGTDVTNDRVWRYTPAVGWTDLSAGMPSGAAAGSGALLYDALLATNDGGGWMGGAIQDGLGPGILHFDGTAWERIPPDGFPLGREFNAMALAPSGRLWAMSTIGGAAYADGEWTRYPSEASFSFLPRFGLDVLEDSQGWVYFNRFGTGAAPRGSFGRIEVATGTHELISPTGNAILRMLEDPAGNRWFARDALDGALRGGIDVFSAANAWHSFDSSSGLPGNTIDNLAILSATRVAMLVRSAGLFVWDHAGTLDSAADDEWWGVGVGIEDASGFLSDDTLFEALAADATGGLWVGQSNGLVRVLPTSTGYRARARLGQKTSFSDGLLGLQVNDLASAPDGSVWVGTDLGLSRVRLDIELDGATELLRWTVTSWTNEAGRELAGSELYGPEVLAPLPSPIVFRVAVNPAGDTVWAATSFGVARLVLQPDPPVTGAALAGAWLYPNPARLALGHEEVRLGGLAVATQVSVYNLEGQLVREVGPVEPGGVAWDLETRFGNRAVSGVYVLRLELQGETALRELVVVR